MPRIAPVVGLIALLAGGSVLADAYDTLNLTIGETLMHDDNLFRLSSSADPKTLLGTSQKSDTIHVTTLGLRFAKDYSLQRFEFDASLVDYRYGKFDYLDFMARNYSAAWRWSLTPRFHGNLTRTRNEALNSFTDYTGYTRQNIRTDEVTRFDGVFEFGPVHLVAGTSRTERINSEVFLAEGDSVFDAAEIGLRYAFTSGASITALTRHGKGEYINRKNPIPFGLYDNGFDQSENEVRFVWPVTGKTRIDGRINRVERKHDHYTIRDYAGTGGNLNVNWAITGKTNLAVTLSREIGSFQTFYSNFTVLDRLAFAPYWQISAKTGLRARYEYGRRSYRDPIISTSFDDRVDTTRTGSLALEWRPIDALYLSASIQNDRRAANKPNLDYKSTMGTLAAQFTF